MIVLLFLFHMTYWSCILDNRWLRGRGALPYWRWRGRAAGQGMIFTVIHIGTGYLNRPNWLLAGYSIYHRVASRLPSRVPSPQCLWQGSQSRHQRRSARDHNVYDRHAIPAIWHQRRRARDAADFYECMMIHSRIESPSVLIPYNYTGYSIIQGMHMKVLVRYIGTRCIFCRIESPSVLIQGMHKKVLVVLRFAHTRT